MNRQELEERLVDYLYDELGDAERRSFEAGLRDNPDLAAEVGAHTRTRAMMQSLQPAQPSQAVLKDVMSEARQELQKEEKGGFVQRILAFLMQPAVATAMVFLLVASATIVLSQDELKDKVPGEQAPLAVSMDNSERHAVRKGEPVRAGVEASSTELSLAEAGSPTSNTPTADRSPEAKPAAAGLLDHGRALAVAPKSSRSKKRRTKTPKGERVEDITIAEGLRPGSPGYFESKRSDWKYEVNAGPGRGGSVAEIPETNVALGFAGDSARAGGKSAGRKAVTVQDLLEGDSSLRRTKADADDKAAKKRPKRRSEEGRKLLLEVRRSLRLGLFKKAQAALDRLKKIDEFRPDYLRAAANLKKARTSRRSKNKAAPAKRAD